MRAKRRSFLSLVGSILLCQAVGLLGTFATRSSLRSWYPRLKKPSFQPPPAVFGPVWTVLYTLMGIAAFLVRRQESADIRARRALSAFRAQLVLNGLWSFLFFGRRSPAAGLADITALLLIPYLLWTSFAAVLIFSTWRLNR
jgi:tryptophan-rich sensory protein